MSALRSQGLGVRAPRIERLWRGLAAELQELTSRYTRVVG